MAAISAEDLFFCWEGYDVTRNEDGISCTIRKVDDGWTHGLGSASFSRGRFRVVMNNESRTTRFEAAVNVGVADAADKPDDVKENYIVWINSTRSVGGRSEGFFWNGTMAGFDTGGYSDGLDIAGVAPLTLDVIVEDRKLFFAVNGCEPVEAFTDLPEVVRPYIFMYGENEVTYFPPIVRAVTLQQVFETQEVELRVECSSLNGETISLEIDRRETIEGLSTRIREMLVLSGGIDLQIRSVDGKLLHNELQLVELCIQL
eukprot:TRINITY_DN73826_c0_g1_i1.p1 TRINITY_DN73826_c0_g1~~TRINITY_DN73826_c0_g1_i1.p1  ORF type:complete len:259 (+),score=33.53 TRINITY_DN73826_c0_g1_i1:151-927(+)